jgi:hypothetical protein
MRMGRERVILERGGCRMEGVDGVGVGGVFGVREGVGVGVVGLKVGGYVVEMREVVLRVGGVRLWMSQWVWVLRERRTVWIGLVSYPLLRLRLLVFIGAV